MTLISANDAFTNPNNPWYYVIGAAFLVLIIAALVIYVTVSNKKRKKREEKDLFNADATEKISDTTPPDGDREEQANAEKQPPVETHEEPESQELEKSEESDKPEKPEKDEKVEKEEKTEEAQATVIEEKEERAEEQKPETEEKPEQAEKSETPKEEEKPAAKPEKTATAVKKSAAPAKKTQKPFIDRLIADKTVHAVYNELKNTILSYPGMKAKLGKDGETFVFGTERKAEISLDGKTIVLSLAVEPDAAPPQFGAEKADGELKTKLKVPENKIDDAQKLIMFAMNISMLTRNDRHRRVDYVQNAINAKNRAKSKQTSSKTKK